MSWHRGRMPKGVEFNPSAVRVIREFFNVSQAEFGRYLQCSTETVRNWEKGRSCPSGYFIDCLSRIMREHMPTSPMLYLPALDVKKVTSLKKRQVMPRVREGAR